MISAKQKYTCLLVGKLIQVDFMLGNVTEVLLRTTILNKFSNHLAVSNSFRTVNVRCLVLFLKSILDNTQTLLIRKAGLP